MELMAAISALETLTRASEITITTGDDVHIGCVAFEWLGGEWRLGYWLNRFYWRRGYMTEAVRAMCAWAHDQPKVRCILAETETDNIKSQNVLCRCGFKERSRGETLWWQL